MPSGTNICQAFRKMSKKKSTAPNGFMLFTTEWKTRKGRNMNIKDATTEAGKIWTTMTPQQRGPYNQRAKQNKVLSNTVGNLTCTGVPVIDVETMKDDLDRQERVMKFAVKQFVAERLKRGEMETQPYYFIMVNCFITTLKGGIHVPAEISLAEYSLKHGVTRIYHTLVNPGVKMYGHQYDAQQISDTTHKLPLPPNAKGNQDIESILRDILHFVNADKTKKTCPLYTVNDSIAAVKSVFDFLFKNSSEDLNISADLRIYSIQFLFFVMKTSTCEMGEVEKPKTEYITDAFFNRDYFEYHPNISCPYHEELDRGKYCTQSCVTRWGFTFSDYMCGDIAIELIPGRHVPHSTNVEKIVDTVSIIGDNESVASYSTVASKPLPEHKIYYENQRAPPQERFDLKDYEESAVSSNWERRPIYMPPQPDESHFEVTCDSDDLLADNRRIMDIPMGRGLTTSNRKLNSSSGNAGRGKIFHR